jgi:hypothetical protein
VLHYFTCFLARGQPKVCIRLERLFASSASRDPS